MRHSVFAVVRIALPVLMAGFSPVFAQRKVQVAPSLASLSTKAPNITLSIPATTARHQLPLFAGIAESRGSERLAARIKGVRVGSELVFDSVVLAEGNNTVAFEDSRGIQFGGRVFVQCSAESESALSMESDTSIAFGPSGTFTLSFSVDSALGEAPAVLSVDEDGDGIYEYVGPMVASIPIVRTTCGSFAPVARVLTAFGNTYSASLSEPLRLLPSAPNSASVALSGSFAGVSDFEYEGEDDELLALDAGAAVVHRLSPYSGDVVGTITQPALSGAQGFFSNLEGDLWVADTVNSQIVKLDRAAAYAVNVAETFGTFGAAAGALDAPEDVAVLWAGGEAIILVADTGNQRVQAFDSAGVVLGELTVLPSAGLLQAPSSMAVHGGGAVLVADPTAGKVVIIDGALTVLDEFDLSGVSGVIPHDVSVLPDGKGFLVSDPASSRTASFDWDGNELDRYVNPLSPPVAAHPVFSGQGLCVFGADASGLNVQVVLPSTDCPNAGPSDVATAFRDALLLDNVRAALDMMTPDAAAKLGELTQLRVSLSGGGVTFGSTEFEAYKIALGTIDEMVAFHSSPDVVQVFGQIRDMGNVLVGTMHFQLRRDATGTWLVASF